MNERNRKTYVDDSKRSIRRVSLHDIVEGKILTLLTSHLFTSVTGRNVSILLPPCWYLGSRDGSKTRYRDILSRRDSYVVGELLILSLRLSGVVGVKSSDINSYGLSHENEP